MLFLNGNSKLDTDTSLNRFYSKLGPSNSVTLLWDSLMTGSDCCGVNNYTDFIKDELGDIQGQVSPRPSWFIYSSKECPTTFNVMTFTYITHFYYHRTPQVPVQCWNSTQMSQGCYNLLIESEFSLPLVIFTLTLIIVWQLLGIILSFLLHREDREKEQLTRLWK